jgi:general secretion pathway protein N
MRTPQLLILFLVGFLLALVACAPLSMVLGAAKGRLTAEKVEGTLWSGRLTGARLSGLPLGAVKTGTQILPLLTGAVRLETEARGGAFTGKGRLLAAGGRTGADQVTGLLALDRLGFAGPVGGTLKLEKVAAVFQRGQCRQAAGKATAQLGGTGPITQPVTLTGAPVCSAGRWVLPMAGEAQGLRIEAQLSLAGDGAWRSELILIPTDPALGQALTAAGFTQDGDRWRRASEGRP